MFACRYGYASIVKLLLDAQADLDMTNDSGNTAVHEAASLGHLDCLHLLLLCGATATTRNAEGDSAADIAAKHKHYSCLTLLRRHVNYAPRAEAGARHAGTPPLGTAAARTLQGYSGQNTVLEVGLSTTSESDPLYVTGSSSDPAAANLHGAAVASGADNLTSKQASVRHRRGRRSAGRPPQVEYVGNDTDSDLDEVAQALGHQPLADSDGSGRASSASSEEKAINADQEPRHRQTKGTSSRSRHGNRERSPVALGLLNRVRLGSWFGVARRWASGPIQADLGEENRFYFNEATGRWELPDGAEDE
jgi:hypothetical protein